MAQHSFPGCQEPLPPQLSFHCGLLNRLQGGEVVWLTELIGDVLGIDDAIVSIKHEDSPLQETPLFEPHRDMATIPAKLGHLTELDQAFTVMKSSCI
jgi:hypothetical protein